MLDLAHKHKKMLYPVVRVRAEKAAGSGTVLYSKPHPNQKDEYETFILTNHHVIDSLLEVKKAWDPVVKREIKKEFTRPATVELFEYVYLSERDSVNAYDAQIVAYDKDHDLALLKLDSPRPVKYLAELYPKGRERDIKLTQDIIVCGCSLAHDPFMNVGQLTFKREYIDNKLYWMGNANSIFGNSGGAVYLADTGQFIGVPARITGLQLGFGVDIITWMGFFIPISRVYEWMDEQELQFLYDDTVTSTECFERRKQKQEKAKLAQRED